MYTFKIDFGGSFKSINVFYKWLKPDKTDLLSVVMRVPDCANTVLKSACPQSRSHYTLNNSKEILHDLNECVPIPNTQCIIIFI